MHSSSEVITYCKAFSQFLAQINRRSSKLSHFLCISDLLQLVIRYYCMQRADKSRWLLLLRLHVANPAPLSKLAPSFEGRKAEEMTLTSKSSLWVLCALLLCVAGIAVAIYDSVFLIFPSCVPGV